MNLLPESVATSLISSARGFGGIGPENLKAEIGSRSSYPISGVDNADSPAKCPFVTSFSDKKPPYDPYQPAVDCSRHGIIQFAAGLNVCKLRIDIQFREQFTQIFCGSPSFLFKEQSSTTVAITKNITIKNSPAENSYLHSRTMYYFIPHTHASRNILYKKASPCF
ncbi:MAG: hypothetical protein L6W00_30075 [Lentisphaeria bacterium]|nr:MAG: hypothetical protein L6W00_30075 [Lentisphaeria bacterium]